MKVIRFVLLAAVLVGTVTAQTPQTPQSPQRVPDITVNTTIVSTVFTVTDKNGKGRFITNLSKEDFKVYEDDKLQGITSFSTETNLPLSIALLVDTSGSVRDRLKAEQEAAIDFFYTVMQRGKDRGLVISFDSGVDLRQDFIDNPEKLADAIRKMRVGGGTSIFDAVQLAITERLAKEAEERRKILILISDGEDNSSHASMDEALELAQRHNVTIYTISTNTQQYFATKSQEVGDKTLRKFADDTGGFPFFPPKMNDMAANFADIQKELRAQYSIAYRPIKPNDGAYRKLRLEVTANKDFKVRARAGYFSPKPVPSRQQ